MKNVLLVLVPTILFCSAISQPLSQKTAAPEEAIEVAIADFLKCRLSKNHNVFAVSRYYKRGEYDRFEISDDLNIVGISSVKTSYPDSIPWFDTVLGREISHHKYYITLLDTLGSTRLPTRHIIKDGKLFYWDDSDYGLTEEMIKTLLDYNLAERINVSDISYLGLIGKNQDFVTVADYYLCKNNPDNYKRVITSIATGWYKPPTIKCR